VALHDIGKVSRGFQGMVPEHWPAAALGSFPVGGLPPGPRRDAMGVHRLKELPQRLEPILLSQVGDGEAWIPALRAPSLRAITGHPGRPCRAPLQARRPASTLHGGRAVPARLSLRQRLWCAIRSGLLVEQIPSSR
jgi:hypothetical protein